MTVKENIEQMIAAIAAKDSEVAGDMFRSVVFDKVSDALSDMKVDVAVSHFNKPGVE